MESRNLEFRKRNWRERLPNLGKTEFVRAGVLDGRVVAFYNGGPDPPGSEEIADGKVLYLRRDVQGMGIGTHMRIDYIRTAKKLGYRSSCSGS
jgi:hypothetical protein